MYDEPVMKKLRGWVHEHERSEIGAGDPWRDLECGGHAAALTGDAHPWT